MRVAGVTPKKEKEILSREKTELFDKQAWYLGEKEKTPENLEVINGVLENLSQFIKKYGGIMPPITSDHVHILDYNSMGPQQKECLGEYEGRYIPAKQSVIAVINKEQVDNNLTLARVIGHELIHFAGFQSITANLKKRSLSFRVGGVNTLVGKGDEKEYYFTYLNEAITEELTEKFEKKYFSLIPGLSEDTKIRNREKEKIKGGDNRTAADTTKSKLEGNEYLKGRKKLKEIIKEIQLKNPRQFDSEEDVFNVFAEAYFTGKRLMLAKLIEKTYGEGSFRKLGEETKARVSPSKFKN